MRRVPAAAPHFAFSRTDNTIAELTPFDAQNRLGGTMRTQFTAIAFWSWIAIPLVWVPGYFTRKRTASTPHLALQVPASALIVICFLLLFRPVLFRPGALGLEVAITPQTPLLGAIGLALDLVGIALAIWARLALGSNWSGIVVGTQEEHELVQTGPYALVRHPIYSGLLLAIVGTALTLGRLGSYVAVVTGLVALLIRIEVEERLMQQQFGEAHRAYRQRTWKLIPFVW
jgi:protein-S-isoprenylcysteine O-methyltransferase Ste14